MGTLYDKALEIKAKNTQLIKNFENQIYTKRDRDKVGLRWSFAEHSPAFNKWDDLTLKTGLSHGYYGHSSCKKDSSKAAGIALATTLNKLKSIIIETTIERLKAEIIVAAEAAKAEAEEILAKCREV